MSNYQTPGVYVEEISTLAPSVAAVSTAIPAFIGLTEKAVKETTNDLELVPTKVNSINDYVKYFGKGQKATIAATIEEVVKTTTNGNGVSSFEAISGSGIGTGYSASTGLATTGGRGSGLTVDITVGSDGAVTGVTINTSGSGYAVDDNITITGGDSSATITVASVIPEYEFVRRSVTTKVITESLKKYYMYESIKLYFDNGGGPCYVISVGDYNASLNSALLKTGLDELAKEDEPTLIVFPDIYASTDLTIYNDALAQCHTLQDRFLIMDVKTSNDTEADASTFRNAVTSEYVQYGAAYYPSLKTTLSYDYNLSIKQNFKNASNTVVPGVTKNNYTAGCYFHNATMVELKALNKGVYNTIIAEANKTKITITLPPSGAVAGVYAQTDRDRGVWKAPANIALNNVVAPAVKITDATQASLNIDADAGKSINAIRSFTGKGTLVWGARTLDGNSNEWRYIQVRRLFNYVEESIKKSTSWAVFEANDANTHIRVKAQIESFLTGIWKAGGLVGASAAQAFFVNVGLGSTVTPQDVLEGKMNVEIGLAASRPAEFIILKFSHFIQQS